MLKRYKWQYMFKTGLLKNVFRVLPLTSSGASSALYQDQDRTVSLEHVVAAIAALHSPSGATRAAGLGLHYDDVAE